MAAAAVTGWIGSSPTINESGWSRDIGKMSTSEFDDPAVAVGLGKRSISGSMILIGKPGRILAGSTSG
jgi:hypothetical protein